MDNFDIHKWQRESIIQESTIKEDNVLDFSQRFKTDFQLEDELNGAFDKLKSCLQTMSLDDEQNQYLTKQLAHHYNSLFLQEGEDTSTEN
jgi:hypothetical protein